MTFCVIILRVDISSFELRVMVCIVSRLLRCCVVPCRRVLVFVGFALPIGCRRGFSRNVTMLFFELLEKVAVNLLMASFIVVITFFVSFRW